MLKRLILAKLDSLETKLGGSLDYLRHMVRVSLPAFFKFAKILPMASYRRVLPVDAYHVATLVASQHEDCGTCLQIGVNAACKEGVDVGIVRAVVHGTPDSLTPELADAYRFAQSVVSAQECELELRERIAARYGDRGFIEFGLAMAAARVFPTVKRAMGFATSCSRVELTIPDG